MYCTGPFSAFVASVTTAKIKWLVNPHKATSVAENVQLYMQCMQFNYSN